MGALAVDEISIYANMNQYVHTEMLFFWSACCWQKKIVARGCKSQIVYLKSLQLL